MHHEPRCHARVGELLMGRVRGWGLGACACVLPCHCRVGAWQADGHGAASACLNHRCCHMHELPKLSYAAFNRCIYVGLEVQASPCSLPCVGLQQRLSRVRTLWDVPLAEPLSLH